MTNEKKTRTPRTVESITKGALALPLAERIDLVKELKASIETEVATIKEQAERAVKLSDGI